MCRLINFSFAYVSAVFAAAVKMSSGASGGLWRGAAARSALVPFAAQDLLELQPLYVQTYAGILQPTPLHFPKPSFETPNPPSPRSDGWD